MPVSGNCCLFSVLELLLLVLSLLEFVQELLNVGVFIEILLDQNLRESLVEDEDVIVLIEADLINTHESEEFWVNHFFGLQDSHFVREDLA